MRVNDFTGDAPEHPMQEARLGQIRNCSTWKTSAIHHGNFPSTHCEAFRPVVARAAQVPDIRQIRLLLKRTGYPRVQMLLVVSITAGMGFLSSFLLLHAGLSAMWVRYPIAVAIAYLVFLFLLWLWLRTKREDYGDISDPGSVDFQINPANDLAGGGGEGGGGGASGSFEGAEPGSALQSIELPSVGEAVSSAAEAEEFAIPLIIVVLVGFVFIASLWAMVAVPILIAELLLDGVLAGILYRRLRRLEAEHWLESAIQITFWPFLLAAIVSALCGFGMQLIAPEADTVGQVVKHLKGL
jgi:uncharacterized membrane protein YgcG